MPIAAQHALTNKISTGSATPMSALEYAKSGPRLRIKDYGGERECTACKANRRSMNPSKPPLHPNCRCQIMRK